MVIEKTSNDRKWRYDCLLRTGGKHVAVLEVLHSHKVTREKASSVRDAGLEIAEFRAEDILHLLTDSPSKTVHLENLLMRHVTCCHKCIKLQTKMEMPVRVCETAMIMIYVEPEASWDPDPDVSPEASFDPEESELHAVQSELKELKIQLLQKLQEVDAQKREIERTSSRSRR